MRSLPHTDTARTLTARERASVRDLLRAARVGGCCRYLGVSTPTLDRVLRACTAPPRSAARIRERLGPGAFFTPNAKGDA